MIINNNGFSRWLRNELDSRSWSQADLSHRAERLGYTGASQSQVSRVMANKHSISDDFCAAIAVALGVPLEEVLEHAGILKAPGKLPPRMKTWPERLEAFTETEQAAILSAMESPLLAAEAVRHAVRVSY